MLDDNRQETLAAMLELLLDRVIEDYPNDPVLRQIAETALRVASPEPRPGRVNLS